MLVAALLVAGLVVYPLEPAAAVAPFTVGATTSVSDTVGSGNTCAGFLDERAHLGPLAIRRVFTANGSPPNADAVNCQLVQGGTLWYSFKTSCTPAGVAAGLCDGEIATIAAAMPSGSYLTYFHEPEDDMTGVQFVAAFTRVYVLAKLTNPAVKVVPVYMSYQWRPGSTKVTNNGTGGDREVQDWIVPSGYADAYGFDLYWQASTRGSEPDDPVSVGLDPRMIRWYAAFGALGRPLALAEWGIDDDQGVRASRGPGDPRLAHLAGDPRVHGHLLLAARQLVPRLVHGPARRLRRPGRRGRLQRAHRALVS
ncbi:hypothetical protein ACQP00_25275 [Dactylosporangium sp. CS-047395]|uniref:hypothetical protein n=1 Tax=Dactylosporangium sp. CS-047395 TaxID=3239936 RepID=UPI003D8E6E7C